MRIAVVGAGGYIGGHLVRACVADGHDVTPVSSSTAAFDAVSGLINDAALSSDRTDTVVYLSQSPHYRDVPRQAPHLWAVNVVSAIKAAEWARRVGARRFIYASSGNVYQPSFAPLAEDSPLRRDNWYALSKVHAEEAVALHRDALAVTCVRMFGVYGPRQNGKLVPILIDAVRERRTIRLQPNPADAGDADGIRLSLVYVDDIVEVLLALATSGGPATLNIAGPDACSVREIASRIGRRIGIDPVFSTEAPPREGDLIADRTRLTAASSTRFRSFDEGLDFVLGGSRVPRARAT